MHAQSLERSLSAVVDMRHGGKVQKDCQNLAGSQAVILWYTPVRCPHYSNLAKHNQSS
jgi:hypothetical protein